MNGTQNLPWYVMPALTFAWTLIFAAALAWVLHKGDQNDQNLMIGSLISIMTGVIGYWFGSSHGSAMKDQALAAHAVSPVTSSTS
jgi:hypothetical protein